MISATQREHLMYTMVGQISILAFGISWIFYYIFPWYEIIQAKVDHTNTTIQWYYHIKANWLSTTDLQQLTWTDIRYEELRKLVASSSLQIDPILIKKGDKDQEYLKWIKNQLSESEEERNAVVAARAAINGILPTMTSIGGSIQERTLSVRDFILFMEEDIFQAFKLSGTQPIGINGINFAQDPSLPLGVGYLDFDIPLKWSKDEISNRICTINEMGDPFSLNLTWALTRAQMVSKCDPSQEKPACTKESTKILCNPLFTITSLQLDAFPGLVEGNKEITGSMKIRLFIRWGNDQAIRLFQDQLLLRIEDLEKEITKKIKECTSNKLLCPNEKWIQTLEKKVDIIAFTIRNIVTNESTTLSAYRLWQFYSTVANLEEEFQPYK